MQPVIGKIIGELSEGVSKRDVDSGLSDARARGRYVQYYLWEGTTGHIVPARSRGEIPLKRVFEVIYFKVGPASHVHLNLLLAASSANLQAEYRD